jgi:pSer/pThr/pTyr-binding forkhead associated (FHA) protein
MQSPPDTAVPSPSAQPSALCLVLIDEAGDEVSRFPLSKGETTIGREGAGLEFTDDVFMSPLHVKLTVHDDTILLRDLGSRNGTWIFLEEPHLLIDSDRMLIGSQIFEFRRLGYPGPNPPERDATRRMGSLVPSADIACITQLRADGSPRDVIHLSPGRNLSIGRENGDIAFRYDPSMSGSHAEIRSEDADFVVVDLGSRNGVAVAARGTIELTRGSRFLVGDKMLKVDAA